VSLINSWLRSFSNILRRILTAIPHLDIVRELDLLKSLISYILCYTGVTLIPLVISVNAAEIHVPAASIHGLALFTDFDRFSFWI
jgi:hypothetical protein